MTIADCGLPEVAYGCSISVRKVDQKRRLGRLVGRFLRTMVAVAPALCICYLAGCMSLGGWCNDYDTAEARQRRDPRDLIIFYKDYFDESSSVAQTALNSPEVKAMTGGMVRCLLVTDYEPDRAYVAQFGVQRAPAVIVVRTDGTYHARVGPMSPRDVIGLLTSASLPGKTPEFDPYILRPPD